MGFCIYCNKNVYSNTTCPKCYRTVPKSTPSKTDSLSSRVTALFPEEKLNQKSSTDKWQDTYSKKAIFNSGLSAAPIRTRQQRVMPQFTTSSSTSHLQQFDNTKKCTSCQGVPWAADETSNFVRVCEPCRMTGRALPSPTPENSSVSTPVLSSMASSRSTLTSSTSKNNPYFQFQRSRRASMFNRSETPTSPEEMSSHISGPSPTSTVSTSAIASSSPLMAHSPPTSPSLLERIAQEGTVNSPTYRRSTSSSTSLIPSSSSPPPTPQHQTPIEPKKTESTPRRKKVIKKPCKECGQHVSKKDYRGLKIQTGEVLCYHSFCLFCAKCHQNFNSLEFCTDGEKFYHTECPSTESLNSANSSREGSPLSEEEEPYPQTPPPTSADTQFDIASPTDIEPLVNNELPKKQNETPTTTTTSIMCHTCTLAVTDSTCLELANHFYHKECLLCAGCNKTVPTDRKLSKSGDKIFCDHCTPVPTHTTSKKNTKSSTGLRIQVDQETLPKRAPTITTPSDILKSRKKVLPRLGGVRTCARCNESMPFSDTQPGPNASRWHKKCLRCTGCKKQMDSDAHMTVNEETGLCLVHCRECLDDTPKSRFVR